MNDDTPAWDAALAWSEANGEVVNLLGRAVYLKSPPALVISTQSHGLNKAWGMVGNGARVWAQYNDINRAAVDVRGGTGFETRNFWLNGINFRGEGTARAAVRLGSRTGEPGTQGNFYNAEISHLRVEGGGFQTGMQFSGYLFEIPVSHVQVMGVAQDGFFFELAGGNVGTVFLSQFIASQCGRNGIRSDGSRSVVLAQGYIRDAKEESVYLSNGIDSGVTNVWSENAWFDTPRTNAKAHFHATNSARFTNVLCGGLPTRSGSNFMFRKNAGVAGRDWTLISCNGWNTGGGIVLGRINADGAGAIVQLDCSTLSTPNILTNGATERAL